MSERTDRVGTLNPTDHARDASGMAYVYPVVSRRTGGVSVGVNLNPNRACNWRCVYCQVPGLLAGKGPPIDLGLLGSELREMLEAIVHGDFLARSAPGRERLTDIALSGDGEPTTSPSFGGAVGVAAAVRSELGLRVPLILITNGSMLAKSEVTSAIGRLAAAQGEIWFKLDSATAEGSRRINSCHIAPADHLEKLALAASLCPTWIQTCFFCLRDAAPAELEQTAYLDALASLRARGTEIRGIHLYTLARPPQGPEALDLAPLPRSWLAAFADRIRALGFVVRVSV